MMKKYWMIIAAALCILMLAACAAQENRNTDVSEGSDTSMSENNNTQEDETKMKMNVQIGDYTFTATLEQNQAVNEFVEMMKEAPVTIEMSDYAGFEKVGPLGKELTNDNHQTPMTEGDIVLYNGNQPRGYEKWGCEQLHFFTAPGNCMLRCDKALDC